MFARCINPTPSKSKQFNKGLSQLVAEGAVQQLTERGEDGASAGSVPILAAVGPLQLEVVAARLTNEYGVDVTFDGCAFRHLGAYAGGASGGAQRVAWRNCSFTDLSAGAITLGGLDTCAEKDPQRWDSDFQIEDCTITNLPVEYTGATAVFFGLVLGCLVGGGGWMGG